jgi:hypothetical protein
MTGPYHYDWCRERRALMLSGTPTLRDPDGRELMAPSEIVCLPEGEIGAHQFLNHGDDPARLLICTAPITGHRLRYPDGNTYVLRVPGGRTYRFRLSDQLPDYRDGEPRGRRCVAGGVGVTRDQATVRPPEPRRPKPQSSSEPLTTSKAIARAVHGPVLLRQRRPGSRKEAKQRGSVS